ncbi:DUF1754-domain-containing protein [Plenodomus tracheiphilus IPT5]|uniref:DUF1754-domain-containing protein n=1 Tax=Plenodomus tracheiphilus IPT5 TaxID=1408161 RepID=A0A6A7B896_9PLEO|nr:DUF1754-domain-containing protein [Plenodomus tracheiphilus IPT5]
MPSSDYTTATGGALKLKGVGGIDKKKRRKEKKNITKPKSESPIPTEEPIESTSEAALRKSTREQVATSQSGTPGRSLSPQSAERSFKELPPRKKTEAERRYDERRRKRLEEQMQKEGVKTHKEKVEELNKYLSGLSEHHDMPKIGPG